MPEADDKDKAEKLAAAKKRFEQLKKQKGKKGPGEKKSGSTATKEQAKAEPSTEDAKLGETDTKDTGDDSKPPADDKKAAEKDANAAPVADGENVKPAATPAHQRNPSLSLQSRIRSSSFRRASGSPSSSPLKSPGLPPLSPDGDTVTDIYRKQARRIEELEAENKRREKDLVDAERRWRKLEEEAEELREAKAELTLVKDRASKAEGSEGTVEKLKLEIAALQRQNAHLQSQSSRSFRHTASPSQSTLPTLSSDGEELLRSKSKTIESMETEISDLRAQLGKVASSSTARDEQVAALEDKLQRSEKAADLAQQQLADLKKSLDRTSERAVKEGSQRTSAETKVRTLERELADSQKAVEDLTRKTEALEKKNQTLVTLHKESDGRSQARIREHERVEKEMSELKGKLASMDTDIVRLREEKERLRKRHADGAIEDDGVDELEDEERSKLQSRIRELEGEVFDLKKGVWKEKRKELEFDEAGNMFDDVDLGGPHSPSRNVLSRGQGFSNVLTDGLSALTGRGGPLGLGGEEDDDFAFDEVAFRQAQELEAKKRVERVKEIKRGLTKWQGWRLDLVESRAGGGGVGPIFEV